MNEPEQIKKYYDHWTNHYLDIYGTVIQAYRPEVTEDLLDYLMQSIGIEDGMWLLDAGCGVCGPAIHFAKNRDIRIEALTISPVQAQMSRKLIKEAGLEAKIRVHEMDFHDIEEVFEPLSFDGIIFLEALGHSHFLKKAVYSTWPLIRQNGFLYIKDFFPRESKDPELRMAIAEVIRRINEAYAYNVQNLHNVISLAREVGFEINWIKKPEFENDLRIRSELEDEFGINLFNGQAKMVPAEWLELKFSKGASFPK